MDYKKWIENIDVMNPDECVKAISELCKSNIASEQKLYAIQLLSHDSALCYNNALKNKIEELKKKNDNLKNQLGIKNESKTKKKVVVVVRK